MQPSEDHIKEFQELYKKEYGVELSREEAEDSARRLVGLAEIMWELYLKDKERQKKLEEFPKGFPLDADGHTCFICDNSMPKEQSWYDKWGMKCLICQKAVDQKIIPGSAAKDKDSWYSIYDLESSFNLKSPTVTKFIRQGILKARVIPGPSGRPHAKIFLIKDNKDTLPPKKLVEWRSVRSESDPRSFTISPWYRFVDPRVHLKGYKIMDHLEVTYKEEEKVKEVKRETMKIKQIFTIGGIMQSIGGTALYLDRDNCVVHNKSKNEDAVILHLKRESDGEEGNVYIRVKSEFKELKDALLNWAFASQKIMGVTINQLENLDTDLEIEKVGGKLTLRQ